MNQHIIYRSASNQAPGGRAIFVSRFSAAGLAVSHFLLPTRQQQQPETSSSSSSSRAVFCTLINKHPHLRRPRKKKADKQRDFSTPLCFCQRYIPQEHSCILAFRVPGVQQPANPVVYSFVTCNCHILNHVTRLSPGHGSSESPCRFSLRQFHII